jgi:HD-GYP domain-containing protein (c-di-GMP phosphodiesterase class II)
MVSNTGGLGIAMKAEQLPHAPIFIKPSQLNKSDADPSKDWGFIHQQIVIKCLLTQMEIFDPALLEHSRSVTHYTLLMAQSLGFTPDDEIKLLHSSLLYDLGMMGIGRRIKEKEGKLTPQEWEIIHAHPHNGVKMLSIFPFLREIIPIIRHHHEWYDGTGYPDGLMGEDIPLMSRIIMIADTFVALTTDRAPHAAFTFNEALGIINQSVGGQFDPHLADVFTTVILEEFNRCDKCTQRV